MEFHAARDLRVNIPSDVYLGRGLLWRPGSASSTRRSSLNHGRDGGRLGGRGGYVDQGGWRCLGVGGERVCPGVIAGGAVTLYFYNSRSWLFHLWNTIGGHILSKLSLSCNCSQLWLLNPTNDFTFVMVDISKS